VPDRPDAVPWETALRGRGDVFDPEKGGAPLLGIIGVDLLPEIASVPGEAEFVTVFGITTSSDSSALASSKDSS
jgi:hypothetical protein